MGGQACRAKLREYVHTIYITHFHALSGPVNGQSHSTVDNHKTACRIMVVVIYYNVPLSIRSVHYLLLSYQQWKCSKYAIIMVVGVYIKYGPIYQTNH